MIPFKLGLEEKKITTFEKLKVRFDSMVNNLSKLSSEGRLILIRLHGLNIDRNAANQNTNMLFNPKLLQLLDFANIKQHISIVSSCLTATFHYDVRSFISWTLFRIAWLFHKLEEGN